MLKNTTIIGRGYSMSLDISDDEFKKLKTNQKLDIIYENVKHIAHLKKIQKMQWYSIGFLSSAIGGVFYMLWEHIKT